MLHPLREKPFMLILDVLGNEGALSYSHLLHPTKMDENLTKI
jgi:hypothetical protein